MIAALNIHCVVNGVFDLLFHKPARRFDVGKIISRLHIVSVMGFVPLKGDNTFLFDLLNVVQHLFRFYDAKCLCTKPRAAFGAAIGFHRSAILNLMVRTINQA